MKKIRLKTTMIAASVISLLGFCGCRTQKGENTSDSNGNRHKIDRERIIDDIGTVRPLYAAPRPPKEMMKIEEKK